MGYTLGMMELTQSTPESSALVVGLTASAVEQVKRRMARAGATKLALRVVKGGCNGLEYDMKLVSEANPSDVQWTQDGVELVSDADSLKVLAGTQLDYEKSDIGGAFKFNNPNAKSSCGCGTSFAA